MYLFFAAMLFSVLSFAGYAQSDAQCAFLVKGTYNTVSAASDNNPRAELFAFTNGSQAPWNEYGVKEFASTDNPFNFAAHNNDANYFLYINNVRIPNAETGGAPNFNAQATVNSGDVIKFYDHEPYVTNLTIGFQNEGLSRADLAGKVEVKVDGINSIQTLATQDTYELLEGTKVEVKAASGYTIANVNYCNEDVNPVDGVYTIYADRKGDAMLNITVAIPFQCMAFANGTFYTATVKSTKDGARDAIAFTYDTYNNEYRPFSASKGDNPYEIKAQNPAKAYFFYQNGNLIQNIDQDPSNNFAGEVTLAEGDVLKFYDHQPYTAKLEIGFTKEGSRPIWANQIKAVVDGITVLTGLEENESAWQVLEGTKLEISAAEGYEIKAVYCRNEEVAPQGGVYTVNITDQGDWLVNVEMKEYTKALAVVTGEIYTASVVRSEDNRGGVSFNQGTYTNEYKEFAFSADENPFTVNAYGPGQKFFVYKNNEQVANTQDENFKGEVTLAENDVIRIYASETAPVASNVTFSLTGEGCSFDQITVVQDGIINVTESTLAGVLEGTKFEIKANGRAIDGVTVNGTAIQAVDGVYTFNVGKAAATNVVVEMIQVGEGVVFYNGKFNYANAQSKVNPRVAAFDETGLTCENEYRGFSFNKSYNPFVINAMNAGETFSTHVYLNNVELKNAMEGQSNFFRAEVNFKQGDVLKIFDKAMSLTDLFIGFMGSRATDAGKVIVTLDGITPWDDLATVDCKKVFVGTKVQIKAAPGASITDVTYCNETVTPEQGVYTFYVKDLNTLANITVAAELEGRLYVDGAIKSFTAQNVDNPRTRAFEVNYGTYTGEYRTFKFDETYKPMEFKGAEPYFVYLNNEEVVNQAGVGENIFYAPANLNAGDVVKVFAEQPYVTNMGIGFMNEGPRSEFAPQVVVTMDEIVPVEGLESYDFEIPVLKGTKFEIKAAEGCAIKNVYYCNEDVLPVDGVYTVYADREGDALLNIELAASGIDSIIDDINNGDAKVYNLQGMEVSGEFITTGIYIVNGKKVFIQK